MTKTGEQAAKEAPELAQVLPGVRKHRTLQRPLESWLSPSRRVLQQIPIRRRPRFITLSYARRSPDRTQPRAAVP